MPLNNIELGKTKKVRFRYLGKDISFSYTGSGGGNKIQVYRKIGEDGNPRIINDFGSRKEIKKLIRSKGYYGRIKWMPEIIKWQGDFSFKYKGRVVRAQHYKRGTGEKYIYVFGYKERDKSEAGYRLVRITDPKEQEEVRGIIRGDGP